MTTTAPSMRSPALVLLALVAGCNPCGPPPSRPSDAGARVRSSTATLGAAVFAPELYARAGDRVLVGSDGARLVFASTDDERGRRPLRGAIVDMGEHGADSNGDGLVWWRTGVMLADGTFAPLVASVVGEMTCPSGAAGVKILGDVGAARLETHLCPQPRGAFSIETRALRGLASGTAIADELNTGASVLYADRVGERFEDRVETEWLAFGEASVSAALEFDRSRLVERKVIRIAAEVFRAEARVRWDGSRALRTLHVARGGVLDAIAKVRGAARGQPRATVQFASAQGGSIVLRDDQGEAIGTFDVRARSATLRLPPSFGSTLDVRDHAGITRAARQRITGTIAAGAARFGVIRATFVDDAGEAAPTKIIVRGIDGTPDPTFASTERRAASHGTVYALDGWAELPVHVGRYRVIGTRGPAFSLVVREVDVADGAVVEVRDRVVRELDTSRYIAGDFHLHAAPSPDSSVSLAARVSSLVCNGVEVAVATDHNAVTDYGPTVRALGLEERIATIVGDELTTTGTLLGHFNVFPLTGNGYGAALPYHDVTASEIIANARRAGASVVQVNHARMAPRIGYFDLTEFDARTGRGSARFAGGFDAFEAFNGMFLEEPERVREGARDVVGLARAGVRAGVTGNSDSHHLVFEEAGWPRTYVRASPSPVSARATRAMEGIRMAKTTVSSGPLVELWVDDVEPGENVLRSGGARRVRARVRVSAASWIPVERVEVWVNDTVAFEASVPPSAGGGDGGAASAVRFERTIDLSLSADAVVLAWASAETPIPHVLPPYPRARPIGFTGPVWVDANGDGEFSIAPANAATDAGGR
ncbi:MAG: CehA/McbA family metallohydrolase [Myxococcales bacterium]|nr:CehA/McbA family metallohydrolase [Myxococcales bacterium]